MEIYFYLASAIALTAATALIGVIIFSTIYAKRKEREIAELRRDLDKSYKYSKLCEEEKAFTAHRLEELSKTIDESLQAYDRLTLKYNELADKYKSKDAKTAKLWNEKASFIRFLKGELSCIRKIRSSHLDAIREKVKELDEDEK